MRKGVWIALGAVALVGCQSKAGPSDVAASQQALSHSHAQRWTAEDEALPGIQYTGDDDKGSIFAPLWRGAGGAFEDLVYAPPNGDCRNLKGTVRINWDKARNRVDFTVKLHNVPAHPSVHRTEGVDFFFNPFHDAAKDFDDGGYKFWIILANINPPTTTFYYDAQTLMLKGSQYDFPNGPPAGTFPLTLPDFLLISSRLMFAQEDGTLVHSWSIPYDHVTIEGGASSGAHVALIPQDLCRSMPSQPTLGQLRPYVTPWQPPGDGTSWDDVLHRGLMFDTTIDERGNQNAFGQLPYVYSSVTFMANSPIANGGLPNGTYIDVEAAIANVQPAFRTVQGGNGLGCHNYVNTPNHVTAPRYCAGER